MGWVRLDHALISALVERWREETHTFHLPVGEATVTLEDVAVLFGLPVDGEPVSCRVDSLTIEQWQALCLELLGAAPPDTRLDHGRLLLTWLVEHIEGMPPGDLPVQTLEQYTRATILCLIGGLLLSDTSDNKVKLLYLPLLRDLDACGRLSWGSAVLAWMYRCLCRSSRTHVRDVCGASTLLQV